MSRYGPVWEGREITQRPYDIPDHVRLEDRDLCELTLADAAAKNWPPGGGMAWDIGANVGQCLPLLTALYERVVALEPGASLTELTATWSAHDQVTVIGKAASDADGQLVLSERAAPAQSGQLVAQGMPYYGEEHGPGTPVWGIQTRLLPVPCVSLDTLAREFGVPDFVKIDTEGGELLVLAGAAGLLAEHRTTWLVEFHSEANRNLCYEILSAVGCKVETSHAWTYKEGTEMWKSFGYLRAKPSGERK